MASEVGSGATSKTAGGLAPIGWRTVFSSAFMGGVVLLGGAAVTSAFTDEPPSVGPWPFLLVAICGFAVAGWWGGRLRGDSPMLHGALAGLGTCAAAQVVGIVGRLRSDATIDVVAVVLALVVAAVTAVAAALAADWHRRNRAPQPASGGLPLGSGESAG